MNKYEKITEPLLIKQQFSADLQKLVQYYVDRTGIRITKIDVYWHSTFYKSDLDLVKEIYIDCKFRII